MWNLGRGGRAPPSSTVWPRVYPRWLLKGVETPAHPTHFGWACIMPAHPGRRLHPQMIHRLSVTGPPLAADPNRKRCQALSALLQSPQ